MGTARKRLVEKTSERPRRIALLVSFLVATGGGKILMHVAALVEVGKLAHQKSKARNYDDFIEISEKLNDACANCHKAYRDKGGTEGSGAQRCQVEGK